MPVISLFPPESPKYFQHFIFQEVVDAGLGISFSYLKLCSGFHLMDGKGGVMGREKEVCSLGPGSWGGHHPELLPRVPQALLGAQPHVQPHTSAPADHATEHCFFFLSFFTLIGVSYFVLF